MWVSLRTVVGSSCVPKVLPVGVGVEVGWNGSGNGIGMGWKLDSADKDLAYYANIETWVWIPCTDTF